MILLSSRAGFPMANHIRSTVAGVALALCFGIGWSAAEDAGQALTDKPDMTWFTDARLGIFIHWGIYSAGNGSESWAFRNGDTPYETYLAQAKTFTAANYHPEQWAELFKTAGARYAVLTAKHHDGFALWDTAQGKLDARDGSPAGRDLVGPFCEALRQNGLKVGFISRIWTGPTRITPACSIKAALPPRIGPTGFPTRKARKIRRPGAGFWPSTTPSSRKSASVSILTCCGLTATGNARRRNGKWPNCARSSKSGIPA